MLPSSSAAESGWTDPGVFVDPDELESAQSAAFLQLIRRKALDALTRSEQGRQKLEQKLLAKGFPSPHVRTVLDRLEHEGLLSDLRYSELWAKGRLERKGEGPRKVILGLRSRGISSEIAQEAVSRLLTDEPDLIMRAARKSLERRSRRSRSAGTDGIIREMQAEGFSRDLLSELLFEEESD